MTERYNPKLDCEYKELQVDVINRHDVERYVCTYQGECVYKQGNHFSDDKVCTLRIERDE